MNGCLGGCGRLKMSPFLGLGVEGLGVKVGSFLLSTGWGKSFALVAVLFCSKKSGEGSLCRCSLLL